MPFTVWMRGRREELLTGSEKEKMERWSTEWSEAAQNYLCSKCLSIFSLKSFMTHSACAVFRSELYHIEYIQ
jgi:hypothetical protein